MLKYKTPSFERNLKSFVPSWKEYYIKDKKSWKVTEQELLDGHSDLLIVSLSIVLTCEHFFNEGYFHCLDVSMPQNIGK